MFQFLLLAAAAILAAGFILRELLLLVHEKSEGEKLLPLLRRFRRRTKSALLLLVLFAIMLYYDDIAAWAHFDWQAHLLAAGGVIIAVIWVLILAARDFRESALAIISDEEEYTRETLEHLEQELRALHQREAEQRASEEEPKGPGEKQ